MGMRFSKRGKVDVDLGDLPTQNVLFLKNALNVLLFLTELQTQVLSGG